MADPVIEFIRSIDATAAQPHADAKTTPDVDDNISKLEELLKIVFQTNPFADGNNPPTDSNASDQNPPDEHINPRIPDASTPARVEAKMTMISMINQIFDIEDDQLTTMVCRVAAEEGLGTYFLKG